MMKKQTKDIATLASIYAAATAIVCAVAVGTATGVAHVLSGDTRTKVTHIGSDCQEVINSGLFTMRNCTIDTDQGSFSIGDKLISNFYGESRQKMLNQLEEGKTYYDIHYSISPHGGRTIFELTPAG